MESGTGIFRTEATIQTAANTIAELKQRYRGRLSLDDHSLSFNTELTAALELGFMLEIGEAAVHSALQRKESRGAHQRSDYPDRDDQNYLKHSLASHSDGAPRIDYRDVVITKWPPGERKYGADT